MKIRFYLPLLVACLLAGTATQAQDATRDSIGRMIYLSDTTGQLVNLYDYPGKVVVVDFWFTTCGGCAHFYQTKLRHAEEHFHGNDDVVFVTISFDTEREQWHRSIAEGKYTSPDVLNLYTGGRRFDHSILKYFGVHRFPSLLIIDREGKSRLIPGVNSKRYNYSVDDIIGFIAETL